MRTLAILSFLSVLCTCVSAQSGIDVRQDELKCSIYFSSDASRPSAGEVARIGAFAAELSAYADYTLQIAAYTDAQGTDAYNQQLAERRAAAIRGTLANYSIAPATEEVTIYGERLADKDAGSDDKRRLDRKVDLIATVIPWNDDNTLLYTLKRDGQQTFELDAGEATTIRGAKGGRFSIEPGSFVYPDGSACVGTINISLTEAYALEDMLQLGLATTSNGKALATGGMVRLTAADPDGRELQLRAGKQVVASMPTDNYEAGMQVFMGEGVTESGAPKDWRPTGRPIARKYNIGRLRIVEPSKDLAEKRDQVAGINRRYVRSVVDETQFDDLQSPDVRSMAYWIKSHRAPRLVNYLRPFGPSNLSKPDALDTASINYEPKSLEPILLSARERAARTASLRAAALASYERRLNDYHRAIDYNGQLPARRAAAYEQFKRDSTVWEAEAYNVIMKIATARAKRVLAAEWLLYRKQVREQEIKQRLMEEQIASGEGLSTESVDRYFMETTELGWINCDRFLQFDEQASLLASIPGATSSTSVFFIPDEIQAVLPLALYETGEWMVEKVGKGLTGRLVVFGVFDGQLRYGEGRVALSDDLNTLAINPEPTSIGQLKDYMAGLRQSK